ncbi:putative gnat family protein [Botrytis fragariae]|uniref:Putative gnat family protein n=1 Tax=Botrytis fragariae TaxID=1964551 RepID=A0A8H6AMK5_9HELO|nr:putative gnat family protein [Botrytis fragariae]KAF5870174.1 putative gnat family protein [Botrytis fragariae]
MTPIPIPSSPSPSFSIHPCTPADLPSMLTIYDLAFASDPFRLARWPSSQVPPSVFTSWLTKVFTKYLHTPHTHTWKLVENSTGNMAGWTHWAEPHVVSREEEEREKIEEEREEKERRERGEGKFPEGSVLEICEAKVRGWDGLREKWYKREEMFLIYFLSISPRYQKLGLGTLLLTAITNLADAQGKSSYLEATAAGYPVYVRAGFREVDCMEVDFGGCGVGRNWAMIRGGGEE